MESTKELNPSSEKRSSVSLFSQMTIWHWLIAIATALGTVLEGILPHSFGVIIANFKDTSPNSSASQVNEFSNASQFQLDWLPAISSALPCILLPLLNIFVQKFKRYYQIVSFAAFLIIMLSGILSSTVASWPLLFLTYSIIYSIGCSLFLAVVVAIVADYFPQNHKLHVFATSLYQIGYPTAAMTGNPLIAALIVAYGWRPTLRYVAILQIIVGSFIALIMKPLQSVNVCCGYEAENEVSMSFNQTKQTTDDQNIDNNSTTIKSSFIEIISRCQIWPWLIGKYINYMCWYALRTNIVTFLVKSTNFGLERSARLMSVYAGFEIIIALIASFFGDKFRGWLVHIHIGAAASMTILTAIYPFVLYSYGSAVVLMILIGTAVQFSLSFGYPASVEVLQLNVDMKIGWLITNVAAGLGILTSPVLSGMLMDFYHLKSLFYAQCVGWGIQLIFFILTATMMHFLNGKSKADYVEFHEEQ